MAETRYYIDEAGTYVGGYSGCPPEEEGLVEVDSAPNDGRDKYVDGAWVPYIDPVQIRDDKLKNLVHDFGDGRVIQVRHPDYASDKTNIETALRIMDRSGQTERDWYMLDNKIYTITKEELEEALVSGEDQADAAWSDFFSNIESIG